ELENRADAARTVEVVLHGTWRWTLRTVAQPQPLAAENRIVRGRGLPGLVLEAAAGGAGAALAVVPESLHANCAAGKGEAPDLAAELAEGDALAVPNGQPLRFRIAQTVSVPAGGRASAIFYFAVAPEREGALATAAYLRRKGAERLLRESRLDLARLARHSPDPAFGAILNRNLVFNLFYGLGRAIDDDRLYPIASRSPLCAAAAVFNEREALLWSLPALLLADSHVAREALI